MWISKYNQACDLPFCLKLQLMNALILEIGYVEKNVNITHCLGFFSSPVSRPNEYHLSNG